jgi:hypothetical protein
MVVLTVLLTASGTMLLWSQTDRRETKADVKTVQETLRLEYQAVVLLSKSAATVSFSRFFPYQLWI